MLAPKHVGSGGTLATTRKMEEVAFEQRPEECIGMPCRVPETVSWAEGTARAKAGK